MVQDFKLKILAIGEFMMETSKLGYEGTRRQSWQTRLIFQTSYQHVLLSIVIASVIAQNYKFLPPQLKHPSLLHCQVITIQQTTIQTL